jgi:hypothetical protein
MIRALTTLALLALLVGCATTTPTYALRLEESTLEVREAQTRTLVAPSEIAILTATIAVLQDMEFNVERIEKPLGVITASKITDADSASEKTGLFFLDLVCALGGSDCGAMNSAQDDQQITMTIVVLPSLARSGEFRTRITMQRVVYDKMDRIKVLERIGDPAIYQAIFDNLQKSLFLEASEQ